MHLTEEVLLQTDIDMTQDCANIHKDCEYWASVGECDKNPNYMHYHCAESCNTCNVQTKERHNSRHEHEQRTDCKDIWKNANDCKFWASIGECDKNTPFMLPNCQKSCNFCSYESRCDPYNHSKYDNYASVAINNNIFYKHIFIDCILNNSFIVNKYGARMVSFDPPILIFDRFLEYDNLINEFVNIIAHKYESSRGVGSLDDNFVYENIDIKGRTSKNAWCLDECLKYNSTELILHGMEEILGIPRSNFEPLQILKYEIGEKYDRHHDYIETQNDMVCGPRILTFFLYLNDVEQGGYTSFTDINISVDVDVDVDLNFQIKPKKGRAVLWPNVANNNLFDRLDDTYHAALPVIKGVKYGVNAWIHLYEFMHHYQLGCTG